MELTKEYFDKGLKSLDKRLDEMATKQDVAKAITPLATKQDVAKAITPLATKQDVAKAITPLATKQDVKDAVEELARIANSGFEDILDRLDVRERMIKMEKKMRTIEEALHIKIEA